MIQTLSIPEAPEVVIMTVSSDNKVVIGITINRDNFDAKSLMAPEVPRVTIKLASKPITFPKCVVNGGTGI